jgi:ankyrin repeat protein
VNDNHNDDIKIVIKTFFKKDNCLRKCNCNVDDINCSLMLDFNGSGSINKYSKNALLIQNKDDEKRNVLHYVIMSGAKQVLVLAIIERGGRDIVNAVDSKRRNCLHYECAYTRHTDVINAILDMNLDLAKREDINGRLPLHHLLKNGSFGDDNKLCIC